jgi:endonuclease/exonuclease/phosphatase family metal-dependent hydrolase
MNTELNGAGNDSLQISNVAEIMDAASKYQNTPVILVGCMNNTSDSKCIGAITEAFQDGWTIAGSGNGFTYPSNGSQKRYDYIFVSNQKVPSDSKTLEVSLRPVSATVITSKASDHFPLLVALKVVSE